MCHAASRVLLVAQHRVRQFTNVGQPGLVSTAVGGLATMVAAYPGIVTVRLAPDFPPYGARANSRVQQPWRWRESLHRNDLHAVRKAAIIRAFGVGVGGPMQEQQETGQQLAPDTHMKLAVTYNVEEFR